MEKFLELVKSPRILHKWTIPVWIAMNVMAILSTPEKDQSFSVMMVVCALVWLVTANGFIEAAVQENEDAFHALFGMTCLFTILLAGSLGFQGLAWNAIETLAVFLWFAIIPVGLALIEIWFVGTNSIGRITLNGLYVIVLSAAVWMIVSEQDLILFKLRAIGVAI